MAPVKPGFHRIELNRTIWEVPERYSRLQAVGQGGKNKTQVTNAIYVANQILLSVSVDKNTSPRLQTRSLWTSLVSGLFVLVNILFLSPFSSLFSSAEDANRDPNTKVAIKKLARPFQSAIHAKRTYRELRLLKHMKHENVIGLLDVFSPWSSLEDFNDVYFVNHLMGADLNQIIKTQKLSDEHVQFLVYQILRGLKYIHSAGIIHRVSTI